MQMPWFRRQHLAFDRMMDSMGCWCREGLLTVESPDMLESEEEIVVRHEEEEDARDKESAVASTRTALEEESEQPQDPLELMGDDFDEPEDVPAVDMQ